MRSFLTVMIAIAIIIFTGSFAVCAKPENTRENLKSHDDASTYKQAKTQNKTAKGYKNPFKPGSYKHFLASKGYPKTYDFWKDEKLLKKASPKDFRLVIHLGDQRGVLYVKDVPALDFPVCSGKNGCETPAGEFAILEKDAKHASNMYGNLHDSRGRKIKSNFELKKDKVPKGKEFKGSPMPYFMRLTYTGVGIHVGKVSRTPSSHGCIRVLPETCKLIFNKIKEGTLVSILP